MGSCRRPGDGGTLLAVDEIHKRQQWAQFLSLRNGGNFQPLPLNDLLKNHVELAAEVQRTEPVLGFFSEYLEHGAYPFFLEGEKTFLSKLGNVIERVPYEDIPLRREVSLPGERRYGFRLQQNHSIVGFRISVLRSTQVCSAE
jgi:hypothetical protein